MGLLGRYGCVLCLFFSEGLILMLSKISVHAAEPSADAELKAYSFKENGFFRSLGLSVSFPAELEISDNCLELLHDFGQSYSSLATCLVSNARPVRVCQECYSGYSSFEEIYTNISKEMGPGNVSCQDVLLRSDRLMLLYSLFSNMEGIWDSSGCIHCLTDRNVVSNTTLYFIERLNQALSCFEKYQQGNHTALCTECKTPYKLLSDLYNSMSKNNTLCIDLEDAMNMTRRLWSKTFSCSSKDRENVPVIAVSSFMLFLPLIFYLSNYLHSEQKKRKLIQPKRAKSTHSLMNIQDKYS